MPTVIRLRKSELVEMATVLIVANTPRSLYEGLLRTRAVDRLRNECPLKDLTAYYDAITARADRSEIAVALAYACLLGIWMHRDNTDFGIKPDASRLSWGIQFESIATASTPRTQIIDVASTPRPRVEVSNRGSNLTIVPASQRGSDWKNG